MSKAALSRAIIGFLATAILLCWTTGCGRVHPGERAIRAQPTVNIAFMPRYSLRTMTKRYIPLVKYLDRETDYDIRYISAVGYSGFLSAVEQADAEFAFVNPVAYVTLHKTRGAYPLVMTQEPDFAGGPPRATYRGVILARADSGIENIADLRGKIIAAAPQIAVAGHLGPVALCRRHGLNVSQQATVVGCPTQEDVLERLQQGRADAGFIREDIWREAALSGTTAIQLSPVAFTEAYPGWCVCAMRDTPSAVAQMVKRALLGLDWDNPNHKTILRASGLHGFEEANDEQYNGVRRLLDEIEVPY